MARLTRGDGVTTASLSGWLYQTARLTAVTFVRGAIRRARREQEAHMESVLNANESEVWKQIAPLLDAAMAGLNETDRHAVVLRFFDGKSMGEIGAALGASEEASKKRVGRALEKLRQFFAKRGVDSTTAAIAETISTWSVHPAPIGLAKTVTAVALAKRVAAGGSTLAMVKGALNIMAWTKAKMPIVLGATGILATGTAIVGIQEFQTSQSSRLNTAAFHVTGTVEVTRPAPVEGVETDTFDVFFLTNRWAIQVHQRSWSYPNAPKNADLFDYTSFNSGSDVFTVAYPTPGTLHRIVSDPNAPASWRNHPEEQAFSLAWTDRSQIPHADLTPGLSALFYAFCSGHYLKQASGHVEPPYWVDGRLYSYDDGATNVRANYSQSPFPPHLPVHIDFLHGNIRLAGPGKWVEAIKALVGLTNATFTSHGYTNVGGLYLPTSFQLVVFSLNPLHNGTVTRAPILQLQGWVSSAVAGCNPTNFQTSLNSSATIADKRFIRQGSAMVVRYVTNKWLTKEQVMRLPQFKSAQLERKAALRAVGNELPRKRSNRKDVIVIVFAIGVLIIAAMLFAIFAVRKSSRRSAT